MVTPIARGSPARPMGLEAPAVKAELGSVPEPGAASQPGLELVGAGGPAELPRQDSNLRPVVSKAPDASARRRKASHAEVRKPAQTGSDGPANDPETVTQPSPAVCGLGVGKKSEYLKDSRPENPHRYSPCDAVLLDRGWRLEHVNEQGQRPWRWYAHHQHPKWRVSVSVGTAVVVESANSLIRRDEADLSVFGTPGALADWLDSHAPRARPGDG